LKHNTPLTPEAEAGAKAPEAFPGEFYSNIGAILCQKCYGMLKQPSQQAKNSCIVDVILLESGDKIPADCRVIYSHSLRCDQAALTGESVPVSKISNRKYMVFAGTIAAYGRGRMLITETALQTAFGSIAREVSATQKEKTPLGKRTKESSIQVSSATN
jgi:P-type E1-E2 ATPase